MPRSDWVRIWFTMVARHLPQRLAIQLQLEITRITMRGMKILQMMSFVVAIMVAFLLIPSTTAVVLWLSVKALQTAYVWVVLVLADRWDHEGRLETRRFNAVMAPGVMLAATAWASLPWMIGFDNPSGFYLGISTVTTVVVVSLLWATGTWAMAISIAIIALINCIGAVSFYDRPSAPTSLILSLAVLGGMLVITVFGERLLVRSVLQTLMAADRQNLIDLLIRDYERGGHEWVWETDSEFRLSHVPPRMLIAACGDRRVRPGASIFEMLSDDDDASVAVKRSEPFQTVVKTVGADGFGEIRVWGRPIMVNDRCYGYRGVGSDAGAARRAADAERSAQRLDAMIALTSGITHDFNNQLATILGSVELAGLPGETPEQVQSHLARAADACIRSRSMTSDLQVALGFHAPSEVASFSVRDEVEAVIAETAPLYPSVTFAVECDEHIGGFADPNHFSRALRNLVENACQATERNWDGSGIVEVVGSVIAGESQLVGVRVTDDGPGIEPHVARRIFEPFYTTRREQGGTGLGLAVAQGFAKQAGGSLVVEPSERGASFLLTVPVPNGHSADPRRDDNALEALIGERSLSGRFLLVEDDEHLATTVTRWLNAFGAEVEWCSTVSEATEHLTAATTPDEAGRADYHVDSEGTIGAGYRCIVTDVVLPDGDGMMLVEAMVERGIDMPTIYMSGFTRALPTAVPEVLRRPLVPKPFSSNELLHALARVGVVDEVSS